MTQEAQLQIDMATVQAALGALQLKVIVLESENAKLRAELAKNGKEQDRALKGKK